MTRKNNVQENIRQGLRKKIVYHQEKIRNIQEVLDAFEEFINMQKTGFRFTQKGGDKK